MMLANNDRVECRHAAHCAGCPLIHLTYPEQLVQKRARVQAAFAFYPELGGLVIEETAGAPSTTGYRVRAKLMVDRDEGTGVRVGLYRSSMEGTRGRAGGGAALALDVVAPNASASSHPLDHDVIDIPGCRVLTPALSDAANAMRRLLHARPPGSQSVLAPTAAGGSLSALDLREVWRDGQASLLVTLVLSNGAVPSETALRAAAEGVQGALAGVAGVAVNYRRRDSPQVLGGTTRVLSGVTELPDASATGYHLATYGAFTQANRAQAARIVDKLTTHLEREKPLAGQRVLDLYAGSGALALPLAARGAAVTLVEAFAPAAEAAARAAGQQNLTIDVRHGDAGRVTRELAATGSRFDAVVVNPPRRGLSPEARRAAANLQPRTIAYVSCDPDTLARDLSHLARLGYRAAVVAPVDMMPLTDQVETVALLERSEPSLPTTLYRDDDAQITELPAYEAARCPAPYDVLAGTVGEPGSGVAIWSRSSAAAATWRAALLAGRREYLALVRGITSPKGSLRAGSRYTRTAIVAGQSLLRVTARGDVQRDLARIGHPIIGDEQLGHQPTNRHFEEKYGLDRAFVHASKVELGRPHDRYSIVLTVAVPGELAAVLARLGCALTSKSPGE